MRSLLIAHYILLSLLLGFSTQTWIEYWDSAFPNPLEAHILQKFRSLSGSECCIPLDLRFPSGRQETFRPSRVVFGYSARDALYVFANANQQPACLGPYVEYYKEQDAGRYVKSFRVNPGQKLSGALMVPDSSGLVSATNSSEKERRITVREPRPWSNIKYPWSISYQGLLHYQVPNHPLLYEDLDRRSRIQGMPQFG